MHTPEKRHFEALLKRASRSVVAYVGVLTLTACSAPDVKTERISNAYKQEIIQEIDAANERTESFWSNEAFGLGTQAPEHKEIKKSDNEISYACDIAAPDQSQEIFYCRKDGNIVVPPEAFAFILKTFGLEDISDSEQATLAQVVVAHEYGHKLQDATFPGGSMQLTKDFGTLTAEKWADCLAGVATAAFPVQPNELDRSLDLLFGLGQPEDSTFIRTHGTPEERQADFMAGFNEAKQAFATKTAPLVTLLNTLRYCSDYVPS